MTETLELVVEHGYFKVKRIQHYPDGSPGTAFELTSGPTLESVLREAAYSSPTGMLVIPLRVEP
jgi:hypothetical protein